MFALFNFLVVVCFVFSLSKFSLGLVNVHAFPTFQSCQSIFPMFSAVEECVLIGIARSRFSTWYLWALALAAVILLFPTFFCLVTSWLPMLPHSQHPSQCVCSLHKSPMPSADNYKDDLAFTSLLWLFVQDLSCPLFATPHKLALFCVCVCVCSFEGRFCAVCQAGTDYEWALFMSAIICLIKFIFILKWK